MKFRFVLFISALFLFCSLGVAQDSSSQDDPVHIQPRKQPKETNSKPPDASESKTTSGGESSSKDSQVNFDSPRSENSGGSGVTEMAPWNPHQAAKDVEVGQYYLKHKNYRAAQDRLEEALRLKPRDAEATYYLAVTQEKMGLNAQAYQGYKNYLSIMPAGPFAKDCQLSVKRLEPQVADNPQAHQSEGFTELMQEGEAALAKNDFEASYERLSKAIQIMPNDPMANFQLAQSLKGLQHLEEARSYFRKYLQLEPNGKQASDARRLIDEINMTIGKG